MEGRLVKRARLLHSALSHPGHAAVRLSPKPRGSLSNLVTVPLPRTQPEPHEVGLQAPLPGCLRRADFRFHMKAPPILEFPDVAAHDDMIHRTLPSGSSKACCVLPLR